MVQAQNGETVDQSLSDLGHNTRKGRAKQQGRKDSSQ